MLYVYKFVNHQLICYKASGLTQSQERRYMEDGWAFYETTDKDAPADAYRLAVIKPV